MALQTIRNIGVEMGKRAFLALGGPWARQKYVARPLREMLATQASNRDITGKQYAALAFQIGRLAPLTAARTIRTFIDESPKLSKRKADPLERARKDLRSVGIVSKVSLGMAGLASVVMGLTSILNSQNEVIYIQENEQMYADSILTVSGGVRTRTLYEGEEANGILRSYCREYFNAPNDIHESDLARCFKEKGFQNTPERFLSWLDMIERVTVDIDFEGGFDEAEKVAKKLDLSAMPQIDLSSTDPDDPRGGMDDLDKLDYTSPYQSVYDTPKVPLPEVFTRDLSLGTIPDPSSMHYSLRAMESSVLYRPVFHFSDGTMKARYLTLSRTLISYLRLDRMKGAYSILAQFTPEIEKYAAILYSRFGKELSLDQLQTFISWRLLMELKSYDKEDPWQDLCACRWAESPLADKIEKAYENISYGPSMLGKQISAPCAAWDAASFLSLPGGVDVARQGFGPYQLLFGLLKRASLDPERLNLYLPGVDATDDKALMRALFERPTAAEAVAIDFVIGELLTTILLDQEVRGSSVFMPFVKDKLFNRQSALLDLASVMMNYPERRSQGSLYALIAARVVPVLLFTADVLKELTPREIDLFPGKMVIKAESIGKYGRFISYALYDPEALRHKGR